MIKIMKIITILNNDKIDNNELNNNDVDSNNVENNNINIYYFIIYNSLSIFI